ncbi:MAG: hypothetical protein AB7S71_17960 [Dongiaceae bacterium]
MATLRAADILAETPPVASLVGGGIVLAHAVRDLIATAVPRQDVSPR